MEAQNEGSGLRAFAFLCVCGLLVFLGFQAFKADHAFLGLALFAAGPIIWAVVESNIKKQAVERVRQEENQPYIPQQQSPAALAHEEPEPAEDGASGMESLRGYFLAGDYRLAFSAIKDGESLTEWCERTAETFPAASGLGKQEIRDLLVSAVQFRKPMAGEPVAVWFDETTEHMREITKNLAIDLSGSESGRQKGETNAQWLHRVGPLFLNVKDGESKDDVIDVLVGIADKAPPNKGECVMAWFGRVRPLVDEHNTSIGEAA